MTDGTLVAYASMDLETTEVVRLDLSESYPRNLDQGATYAYEATGEKSAMHLACRPTATRRWMIRLW